MADEFIDKLRSLHVRRPNAPTSKRVIDHHYNDDPNRRSHVVEVTERNSRHPQGEGQDVTVHAAPAPTLHVPKG